MRSMVTLSLPSLPKTTTAAKTPSQAATVDVVGSFAPQPAPACTPARFLTAT